MTLNRNPSLNTSFLLEIPKFKEVSYFVTNCEVPGLTMSGIETPFKNNQGVLPSNRIDYDPLTVNFIIDEEWANWWSIVQWMQRIRKNDVPIVDDMSDMTLHLVNSNKNLNRVIVFNLAFPTMIASVPLESNTVDAIPVLCSCTFRYQSYEMKEGT